ncbi:protein LEO1 homolog isoform X2 [Sesamum indicum]|uniref:Protein LEO1 homolog isoform X2 n=1 Tax=Sesamum indicum TaxID=4182 RepID=A0A6I9SYM9_SESIN|nr:protein LEO1 homolog isoform X2 [Sesamum indicum]
MRKHQTMQNPSGYKSEEEDPNSNQDNALSEQEHENEGKANREGGAEVNRRGKLEGAHYDNLGSSRSLGNEKGKNPALSSAEVIHEVFGDSGDDEPEEYAVHDCINEKHRSPKYKKNYADESPVENIIPDEDALRVSEEEGTKTKLKGKAVVPPVASEIPLLFPSPCPDQMATINLSCIIGIDPKQFDPATYVEEDFYVTDASGVSRLIPPTNIIRWREVRNPDGTTSVESNARFVTWSDGSLQLLIGNEAFGICNQDAHDIKSYLFLRHEKESYQSQGKISRKMIVMPSSVSSNSNFDWFCRFNA